jgi:hypothetical protein
MPRTDNWKLIGSGMSHIYVWLSQMTKMVRKKSVNVYEYNSATLDIALQHAIYEADGLSSMLAGSLTRSGAAGKTRLPKYRQVASPGITK